MQPTELNLCEKWKPLPSQGRISATFFPDLGEVAQFQDEEYKRAIWEMRKIREQLGKRERGRTINYIIASPSLASLWVQRKHNIFLGLYKVTNEGLAET